MLFGEGSNMEDCPSFRTDSVSQTVVLVALYFFNRSFTPPAMAKRSKAWVN